MGKQRHDNFLIGTQLRSNAAEKAGIPYALPILYNNKGPYMGNSTKAMKPNSTQCKCPGPKPNDVVKEYNNQLAVLLAGIDMSGAVTLQEPDDDDEDDEDGNVTATATDLGGNVTATDTNEAGFEVEALGDT